MASLAIGKKSIVFVTGGCSFLATTTARVMMEGKIIEELERSLFLKV